MDWNYRATAESIGHEIDHVGGDDLSLRLRFSEIVVILRACFIVSYGWALQYKVVRNLLLEHCSQRATHIESECQRMISTFELRNCS